MIYLKVAPDVPKIENSYWYTCDEKTKGFELIRLGTIVRVNLHGRRVRAWVCEIANSAEELRRSTPGDLDPDSFKSIVERVSDGPPEHLVRFSLQLSRYYLVSPVTFLRACSPTRIINGIKYFDHEVSQQKLSKRILVNPREDRRTLIQENIAEKGSTIIVSPDGHLRISKWLEEQNYKVINFSSNDKNEVDNYKKATKNNCVVVGGRSSLFAPVTDCESIIILDDAYEQLADERTPKWNAVDVAKIATEEWGTKLTVITSIPTSSTYQFEEIDCRNKESIWPRIAIDNRNETDPVLGVFSPKVTSAINRALDSGFDVALILNSTVSARLLICKQCDSIATCEVCQHAVIQDNSEEFPFVCPLCDEKRPSVCLACKATTFKKYRRGLQSIAQECKGLFSKRNILEVSKNQNIDPESLLLGPNIFVATESIFHRRELNNNLGCVVFLDIDSIAFRPSMEAFTQTLVIINRALRSIKKSDLNYPIILSTRAPESEIMKDIAKGEFALNLERELDLRSKLKLAPFFATAEIKANKDSMAKFISQVDAKILSGKVAKDQDEIVYLTAANHEQLAEKAYVQTRKLASNARCIISIDSYG